jgi:SAM-dependent methyltransferase
MATPPCAVCGGTDFVDRAVLWDSLAEGWGLSAAERALVDRQQGTTCATCGSNLRSIALAAAILAECGWPDTLESFVSNEAARPIRILEINEAGTLSRFLSRMPGHRFACYPEVDMQAMPFPDGSFDLVVHSDTLEHVPEPGRALAECARVLRPDGALCFTVPVLPGRLSLSRAGLASLYHGDPANPTEDLRVHTDYGANVWHAVHEAGFTTVTLSRFGDGLAITAARQPIRRALRDAQDALQASEARVHALMTSTSWRITAPLRLMSDRLRLLLTKRDVAR